MPACWKRPPKRGGREKIPKKNSMPFALVGCVQKKTHLLRWVMPVCWKSQASQKRRQGEDTQKKQDAIRFSRMRQKNPPAKVSDACVLERPPKSGGRACHRSLRCKLLLSFVDFVLGASERDYLFLENRFFLFGVLQSRIVLVSVLLLWVCIPGSRRCLCWFGVFAIQGRAGLCILLVFFNPGSRWSLYCLRVYVFAIQGHAGLRKHAFAIEGRAGLCIAFARLQSTVVCNPGLHGVFAFCNAGSCWSVLFLCFREAGMGWFGYCCCTMLDRSVVGKCWGWIW